MTMPSSRLRDRAVLRRLDAGRVVAVVAHGRHVGDVDHRRLAALLLQDVDPAVAVLRHRRGIAGKIIADIFVHGGERTQLAIRALRDVDDHVPLVHGKLRTFLPPRLRGRREARDYFAGTRLRGFQRALDALVALELARRSRTCARCGRPTARPAPAQLAPASEWVDLVCVRSGVSRLRQPPRSTDLPGSPIGS